MSNSGIDFFVPITQLQQLIYEQLHIPPIVKSKPQPHLLQSSGKPQTLCNLIYKSSVFIKMEF